MWLPWELILYEDVALATYIYLKILGCPGHIVRMEERRISRNNWNDILTGKKGWQSSGTMKKIAKRDARELLDVRNWRVMARHIDNWKTQ